MDLVTPDRTGLLFLRLTMKNAEWTLGLAGSFSAIVVMRPSEDAAVFARFFQQLLAVEENFGPAFLRELGNYLFLFFCVPNTAWRDNASLCAAPLSIWPLSNNFLCANSPFLAAKWPCKLLQLRNVTLQLTAI